MKKRNSTKIKKTDLFRIVMFIIIATYCVTLIYFILWGLLTSVKSEIDFVFGKNILGLPNKKYGWKFDNYVKTWNLLDVQIKGSLHADALTQFINSILYAGGSTLIAVYSKLFVAYVCAKYKFFLNKILYAIALFTMILPIIGNMPSMLMVTKTIGIYDTMIGSYLMNCGFTGMYFLLFYAAFKAVPNSYMEAAEIDGAGYYTVMFRVIVPMVRSTCTAILLLVFIEFWNNYQQPMIYLPSMPTIAYGLFSFSQSSNAANAPALMSASFLVCIPTFILFLIFKNKLMASVNVGGIKG